MHTGNFGENVSAGERYCATPSDLISHIVECGPNRWDACQVCQPMFVPDDTPYGSWTGQSAIQIEKQALGEGRRGRCT